MMRNGPLQHTHRKTCAQKTPRWWFFFFVLLNTKIRLLPALRTRLDNNFAGSFCMILWESYRVTVQLSHPSFSPEFPVIPALPVYMRDLMISSSWCVKQNNTECTEYTHAIKLIRATVDQENQFRWIKIMINKYKFKMSVQVINTCPAVMVSMATVKPRSAQVPVFAYLNIHTSESLLLPYWLISVWSRPSSMLVSEV